MIACKVCRHTYESYGALLHHLNTEGAVFESRVRAELPIDAALHAHMDAFFEHMDMRLGLR
jgi:hypothetical protein